MTDGLNQDQVIENLEKILGADLEELPTTIRLNIQYYIEHANSHNYNAMKNHYLLTQIAEKAYLLR